MTPPILSLVLTAVLAPNAMAQDLSADAWRSDLDHLVDQLKGVHANPFHTLSESRLEAMAQELRGRLPDLAGAAPHTIVVELARIVAAVGDGHTELWLAPGEGNGFHQLPLRLFAFEEGLFVQAITTQHASEAGARVLRIGVLDVDEAWARVAAVAPRDNEHQLAANVPIYLTVPEVLHALDIAPELDRVSLRVEDAQGKSHEIVLDAGPPVPGITEWAVEPAAAFFSQGYVSARDPGADTPLYLSSLGETFWMQWLEDERAHYVQINTIRGGPSESFGAFAQRAVDEASERGADKLVLDLRHNGGGNNQLNLPWIHAILRSEFNTRGRLFVLIGRHTFSAASHLVTLLETHTEVIFVGEPTGASPNHYGDGRPITLPNSRLVAQASSLFWQNALPWDRRTATAPHVAVAPTFADWRSGRDAALATCLTWEVSPPLSQIVGELLEAGDAAGARAALTEHLRDPRNVYRTAEAESVLNRLGYERLQAGRVEAAVAVFELVTVAFPSSANAQDSLGEACWRAGKIERAAHCYQRAIELDPGGSVGRNARAMLERLRAESKD